MGYVYEAVHEELDKLVAVKLPHPDITKSERELERFKREPKVAAATGHRGIIDVYDVGTTDDGVPFLVMELLKGESLASLIEREGQLDLDMTAAIVAQILSALDAAHAKSIIHRDLKPENVFLVEAGHAIPEVRLLDFGTSKVIEGSKAGSGDKLTESGTIVGTPFYMAPEQMMAKTEIDRRVDVYAVGVIYYEALTGKPPYEADNVYALVNQVINEDVDPPRERREDIPEDIEELILRALDRKRERRFGSATAMLQALMPHLGQVALARVSLPDSIRKSATEVDDVVIGTADTIAGVVPSERDVPTEKEDKVGPAEQVRFNWMLVVAIVAAVAVVFVGLSFMSGSSSSDSVTPSVQPNPSIAPPANEQEPISDGGMGSIATKSADAAQETGRRLVKLELLGMPDGGIVFLDGAKVRGSGIGVEPSQKSRKLRVEVGDREAEQWVTLTEDKTIDLSKLFEVEPVKVTTKKQPRPGKRPGRGDAGSSRPEKGSSSDPEPTKPPPAPELGLDKQWQP